MNVSTEQYETNCRTRIADGNRNISNCHAQANKIVI